MGFPEYHDSHWNVGAYILKSAFEKLIKCFEDI